ncbi:protein-tyrosine phosphatase-like protein, partial [Zopfochytrium polystomum]
HDFPIEDSPSQPIAHLLPRLARLISRCRAARQPVLLHCHAGVSRSATVAVAYLMLEEGLSLRDAFATVYRSRPIVRPNVGFARTLQRVE